MKRTLAFIAALTIALSGAVLPAGNTAIFPKPVTAAAVDMYGDLTYVVSDGEVTVTGCTTDLEEIIIPAEIDGKPVTRIGNYAFAYFHGNLKKIQLPESVEYLGTGAFDECISLEEIDLSNIREIGEIAFHNCQNLKKAVIGSKAVKLGDRAFSGCFNCELSLDPDNTAFSFTNGCILTADGTKLLRADPQLKNCTVPDSVTSMAIGAFESSNKLVSVTLPDGISEISSYAFCECNQLSEVKLPKGLKRIDEYAFCICQGIESIDLPDGLEYIGREAFADVFKMTSVRVPASVKEIGYCALGYSYYDGDNCIRITGFTIIGKFGSEAHRYADEKGFAFTPEDTVDLSKAKVSAANKFYTGKALKPAVTVKLNGFTLSSGSDYGVKYTGNKKVGKAKFTVTGKGGYTGKASGSFIIKPGKEKLTSLKSLSKKTVKARWTRDKQATGYQIRLAADKGFTKVKKTVWIKKNTTTAKTIKGLSSKKTYFLKLRAYKVIGGKKYYGKYSNIKKVKVR